MCDQEGRTRLPRAGDFPLTPGRWRIRVDTGGTFTDGLALAPDGTIDRIKILSSGALRARVARRLEAGRYELAPRWGFANDTLAGFSLRALGRSDAGAVIVNYDAPGSVVHLDRDLALECGDTVELSTGEEAPILAARLLTSTAAGQPLPHCEMRLATTLATNALLERSGRATVLFVTHGLEDLSRIGTQQRPDLFALDVRKDPPLHAAVVGVHERLAADGSVVEPLDLDRAVADARRALDAGIRSAAIALLHAYRNPEHERRLSERLLDLGFDHVASSADLAPRIKLLPRLETAVVDAYLGPLVQRYLERVSSSAAEEMRLLVMTSAGGLSEPSSYRAKDSLLSGPAGGVVGAARAGLRYGEERLIGFDMGGTSTDVARFDGEYEYVYEHGLGDIRLAAPAMGIESVAAGGGSICWLDGERLRVGPKSGGAEPGPACYGAGGPLCVTDLNLLLGRLDEARFGIPIRADAAQRRLDALCDEVAERSGERPDPAATAEGLLAIADETMADAIRRISLRRGYDPAEYALVSFGGAGGQHAAAVARRLGVRRLLVPRDAALLSAIGLDHAVVERFAEEQVLLPLADARDELDARFERLAARARSEVAAAGIEEKEIEIRRRILHLRWSGQESTIEVEWDAAHPVEEAFVDRYRQLFGHRPERRAVEIESIRVVASSAAAAVHPAKRSDPVDPGSPVAVRPVRLDGAVHEVPQFERDELPDGARLDGPALIVEAHSTTVVPPGWSLDVRDEGLWLTDRGDDSPGATDADRPDAIRLELFTQRFASLVREMGERLERTSVSTNVKERLDFSCALLDPDGRLVVNAPHIPVHLGALGLCVRRLSETVAWQPGDVVLTNHPAFGGSHLPDITVVTPVFQRKDGGELLGYVANRAHHAEIGGKRPGSMPPDAVTLAEEGVVLPPLHVIRGGVPCWDDVRRRFEAPPFPSRAVEDNLADLRAAVASNHAGAQALRALGHSYGADTLRNYMTRLAGLSRDVLGERLEAIPDGAYRAVESLDDGTPIAVRVDVRGDRATIDFDGSGGVHPGNFNATPAIVQSAVIYLLRLLIDRPLPLNEGLLEAVSLRIPAGFLNPEFHADPQRCPAVVGGNVETSQRVVDCLIRALELAACGQGTMNNVIFGNADYGYYETIGGGGGATSRGPGASGLHSHMTNTRITDPELLESRYPVRLERFGLRRGSGGPGKHPGGDGLVRELTFLQPASLSLLAQHREQAPFGMAGGSPGQLGRQWIVRADGTRETLRGVDSAELGEGDRFVIETPGGGGWGG